MGSKELMPARVLRAVGAICLSAGAMLLSACGGGGGGGGGNDGPNVSIAQNGPTQVEQTVASGQETQMFTIRAKVSGDVAALNG